MNVSVTSSQSFSVKLKQAEKTKVTSISGGIQVPAEFGDLSDFDVTNLVDNGIIMYNASTQKYEIVTADDLLSAAVSDSNLPLNFVNQLDVDLDNKIDLDAGTF